MINLVARNRKETNLEQMLMDYLTGQTDGIPKDPKWLQKLYFVLQ